MFRASDVLPFLALLLLRSGSASAAPAVPSPAAPQPVGPAIEQPRTRTGGDDVRAWFAERFGLALEALGSMGVPDLVLRSVALALLAQWAHETGRGRSEFNFNLGGWRARKSDPYFVARDVQSGKELFRWTAYPDLRFAVVDQINRLAQRFPSAWKLLIQQPHTSAWVEELGRRGYYEAPPAGYARAWAANRAELERLAP